MNEVLLVLMLLVGMALGALIVWLLMRAKIATLTERLSSQQVVVAEKLQLLEQAEQKLKDAFRSLAADALNSNNQSFLTLAKTAFATEQETAKGELEQRKVAIGEIVTPVKDALNNLGKSVQDIEVSRQGAYSELRTQVQSLQQTGELLRKETASLAGALRSSNVAGNWGQMQLRRVVELAGMIDHCDFREQVSSRTEEGRLQPDLVVSLPGNRKIAVDAKVPLSALLDASNASDDEARRSRLQDYTRNLLRHVGELGKKDYWKQFDQSPDFVVLFLPGETFFHVAQEQEPELITMAWEERVVIATPSTLIALLRAVASYWQQEKLARNAQEISDLGKQIYDRLTTMAEHFHRLGKSLKTSVTTYNEAVGALESRVLVSARKFRELGATPSGEDVEELEPLEVTARALQRLEFMSDEFESDDPSLESRS